MDPRTPRGAVTVALFWSGRRLTTHDDIQALLSYDPTNGYGWIAYTAYTSTTAEQRYCLEQVIRDGPASARSTVQRRLDELLDEECVNPLPPSTTRHLGPALLPRVTHIPCLAQTALLIILGIVLWFGLAWIAPPL